MILYNTLLYNQNMNDQDNTSHYTNVAPIDRREIYRQHNINRKKLIAVLKEEDKAYKKSSCFAQYILAYNNSIRKAHLRRHYPTRFPLDVSKEFLNRCPLNSTARRNIIQAYSDSGYPVQCIDSERNNTMILYRFRTEGLGG